MPKAISLSAARWAIVLGTGIAFVVVSRLIGLTLFSTIIFSLFAAALPMALLSFLEATDSLPTWATKQIGRPVTVHGGGWAVVLRFVSSPLVGVALAPIAGHVFIRVHYLGARSFVTLILVWLIGGGILGLLFGLAYPRWCLVCGLLLGAPDLVLTMIEVHRWHHSLGPPAVFFLALWTGMAVGGSLTGGAIRFGWVLLRRA